MRGKEREVLDTDAGLKEGFNIFVVQPQWPRNNLGDLGESLHKLTVWKERPRTN